MKQPLESTIADDLPNEEVHAIIDVPQRSTRWAHYVPLALVALPCILILLIVLGKTPLGAWFLQLSPFFRMMVFVLGLATTILILNFLVGVTIRRRLRNQLHQDATHSLDQALRSALPRASSFRKQINRTTVRYLAQSGIAGATIRVCEERHAKSIDPLGVIIEPLPLDESLPAIARIASGDLGDRHIDETSEPHGFNNNSPGEADLFSQIRRNINLQGKFLVGILFFVWLLMAFSALMAWRIDDIFIVISAVLILFLFSPEGLGAMTRRQQWFVVPGGLIGRRANWRGGWNVHLFDRRSSVLAVHRDWSQWYACVADAKTHQMATITPTEVKALLSAWLSPLPPPLRERLSDLGG